LCRREQSLIHRRPVVIIVAQFGAACVQAQRRGIAPTTACCLRCR
jgi:hypothetical protein